MKKYFPEKIRSPQKNSRPRELFFLNGKSASPLLKKWFPERHRFPEQILKFRPALPAYVNMVVGAQQAGLEFPVRSHAEPVAEGAEL